MLAGCGADDDAARVRAALATLPPTPAEHREGQTAFDSLCARCHGRSAGGTEQGPPLAHRVYEPSHHGDAAFTLAVRNGVAAHHWRFGDMPAQPTVAAEDVKRIVDYVRWVQRQVGIR